MRQTIDDLTFVATLTFVAVCGTGLTALLG